MVIGTIVKSNSHISYLCRVFGKLETADVPGPEDYAFGRFVAFAPLTDSPLRLVGVVRDTLLLNPDFGNLGPRLSGDAELAVFSPDYLNEKGVLVDVLVLGWDDGTGAHHTVPELAAQVGTQVESLADEDIYRFHRDARQKFVMGYLPHVLQRNDPMGASLLLTILDRLEPAFPDQRRIIAVLKNNLTWKAQVVPAG